MEKVGNNLVTAEKTRPSLCDLNTKWNIIGLPVGKVTNVNT